MKKAVKKRGNPFLLIGLLLLAVTVLIPACVLTGSRLAAFRLSETAETLWARVPARSPGSVDEEKADPSMPVMVQNGVDYIAFVEISGRDVFLPVRAEWDERISLFCPCRYSGSVCNDSLILGGANTDGQFAFTEKLDIGEIIVITDMRGHQYRYEVRTVKTAKTFDPELLTVREMDLMLFAFTPFSSGCRVVLCKRL